MSASLTKIEQFLEAKAEPGQFDSTGEFRISGDKALEKLANHSVQDSTQWVLKLVQAAVSIKAQEIRFFQYRKSNRADIITGTLPSPAHFQEALLQLQHGQDVFLKELCTGLRPLLKMDHLRVLWMNQGAQTGLQWNGENFVDLESSPLESSECGLRIEFPVPLFSFSRRAEETRLLQEYCRWCPIPLKLDSRLVNNKDNVQSSKFSPRKHGQDSPRILISGWFDAEHPRPFQPARLQKLEPQRFQDELRSASPFLYAAKPEESEKLGGFSLFCSYSFASWRIVDVGSNYGKRKVLPLLEDFYFRATRLGVVCAQLRYKNFGVGGEFVMPGDELNSDLTGLTLSLSPEFCEALASHLRGLEQMVKWTGAQVQTHASRTTPADVAEGVSNVGLGIGAGIVVAIAGLASGGIMTLAAPFMPFYFASLTNRDTPEVKQKLPVWLEEAMTKLGGLEYPMLPRKCDLELGVLEN